MDISIILTVIFGIVGLIAFLYAVYQGNKAKKAEIKLVELEQAMTSYKYLKEKAFAFYSNGQYEESLDVFKKYLLNNKDAKEWNDIIGIIFKNETEKAFSVVLTLNNITPQNLAILVHTYIQCEDVLGKSSPYPKLIKTLISDYGQAFGQIRVSSEFIIALFDKNWQRVNELLPDTFMHSDKELNSQFKQYIKIFLNKKLNISNDKDGFADDIPF
jgi:tetratricopeptide (TPR) repeat protein